MIKKQFSFKSQERDLFDGKNFVDREAARKAFNDFVTTDDKEYNVLMFYGIGGVGKSMLVLYFFFSLFEIFKKHCT